MPGYQLKLKQINDGSFSPSYNHNDGCDHLNLIIRIDQILNREL